MNLTRRWAVLPFTQCNIVGEGPFNSFTAAGEACARNEGACTGVVAWDGCTGDGGFDFVGVEVSIVLRPVVSDRLARSGIGEGALLGPR